MRVFVAGATGAIGRRLVAQLVAAGHEVTGMTRTPAKLDGLRARGVTAVLCDALDAAALRDAVAGAAPEVVVHELTEIPQAIDPERIAEQFAPNNRLRREGTRNLVAAALAAGARRLVAESIAFVYAPGESPIATEDEPLAVAAPAPWGELVRAVHDLEEAVLTAPLEGLVLRYGTLYGPGTFYAPDGSVAALVGAGRYGLAEAGPGLTSFVHVDDAAAATVLALDRGGPGVYNVVDDEPAAAADWLPVLAHALGAPPPAVAASPGDLGAGARGASNAKAKRELGWAPGYATWREGLFVID